MAGTTSYLDFTRALIADFRAHGGQVTSGPFVGKPLLLLTTVGAKSGERHTAPLVYTPDGDRYAVIASKGGAPSHPGWYHNLVANPIATVEVGDETFDVRATQVHGSERRRLYDAQAAVVASFADYESRTTREIPVMALERVG